MNPDFNCTGQMAEWFSDEPHGGSEVMVWGGVSYGQRTQLHFIDGNLNKTEMS
jgi:hypothetical protein